MSDRQLAEIVCRALIAIVVGIRKKYELPDYHNVVLVIQEQIDTSNLAVIVKTE